ncbi:MAG: hypothetical protein ACSHYA_18145 [Opitutaceae bacterium]
MPKIRYFNAKGRDEWSKWLDKLREDNSLPFPIELLQRNDITNLAPGGPELPKHSDSKFELAMSLAEQIKIIEVAGLPIEHWAGLWDWLAASYFDLVCLKNADGTRQVKALALYRLDSDFRRSYRHRICGPVSRARQLGKHSKILLNGIPNTLTDWEEQAAARYETGGNPGIAEALCSLYWDDETERPKRGAAPNKKTPGTLRRFNDIIRQLALTYDLSAISAKCLLELLPNEFSKWKTNKA